MKPTSFETSWTEAENAAFEAICTATGSQAGTSAHLGRNPGVMNAWHCSCGKIGIGGEVFYADDIPTLCIPFYAEAVFTRRAACQAWAMRIAAALPLINQETNNIIELRIQADGWGEVKPDYVQVANEDKQIPVWRMRLDCDLVFETGGKSNSATAEV